MAEGLPRAPSRCVRAGVDDHVCNGRPQWHHPIKQQRVKGRFPYGAWRTARGWEPARRDNPVTRPGSGKITLSRILKDPRNRIFACWDAHQAIEGDVKNLPESVWEFAREFGLDAQLENDIARQTSARQAWEHERGRSIPGTGVASDMAADA